VLNILFLFLVPPPVVILTIPSFQRVGQPLTLTCTVIFVRGITSSVDVIWRSNGEVLNETNDTPHAFVNTSLIYTYTIPQLCLCSADQHVYQCEVVINSSPPVIATDSVTLDVMDECEAHTHACTHTRTYTHTLKSKVRSHHLSQSGHAASTFALG